jgi:hypothetical protein
MVAEGLGYEHGPTAGQDERAKPRAAEEACPKKADPSISEETQGLDPTGVYSVGKHSIYAERSWFPAVISVFFHLLSISPPSPIKMRGGIYGERENQTHPFFSVISCQG